MGWCCACPTHGWARSRPRGGRNERRPRRVGLLAAARGFEILGGAILFRTPSLAPAVASAQYIPDGLTKAQWAELKAKEKKAKTGLGKIGARGYKSRSFDSFQRALEAGEATHLLPVFDAKKKVARGELKLEDIPYMQRGGSWDNSDIKGAKKKRWLKEDKEYDERAAQSASIFGGENLPWNQKKPASRGRNVMTDEEMWNKAGAVRGGIKKAGAKIDVTQVKKTGWVMPWDVKK